MARKKSPNAIETEHVDWQYRAQMEWLESEYKLLAAKRNTYAFMYNKARASMGPNEPDSEKMSEWRRECWRIEYILRWIGERYQAGAYRVAQQQKMEV